MPPTPLCSRLDRRGITGVRWVGADRRDGAWVARIGVWPVDDVLIGAIKQAAAPIAFEIGPQVHRPSRQLPPRGGALARGGRPPEATAERTGPRRPVLQASIDRRNPYVDPLSFIQVELLRRRRVLSNASDGRLERVSMLTINGIASGLRNTG